MERRRLRDYSTYSFWLETAGEPLTPRPALDGSTDVDIAILGAGFTGLWTAYYLLKKDPSLKVAILERDVAGFGASGRNGGWCSPKLNIGIETIAEKHGAETSRALHVVMNETVAEIGRVCEEEGIDAGYRQCGGMYIALGSHHLKEMNEYAATFERYGFGDSQQVLDARATAERVRIQGAVGSIYFKNFAFVHPGRLVRGLARTVERLGATLYERTEVTDFVEGRSPLLRTASGEVRARAIVLAGEAYHAQVPRLRRRLLPLYSMIVLTEPLTDAQWAEIGWQGRELVASFRLTIDYLTRTPDDRILFGGRGAPYRFGSAIDDAFDRDAPTHEVLRGLTRAWFPVLKDVRFSHAWGGPLGVPRDWMPTISFDPARGVATAGGYTGHGVTLSNLGGRTLSDLLTGRRTELTTLPLVGHRSPSWEPEPFRWIGVRYVQKALARVDAKAARTGQPPSGLSIAERLSPH
jgi:glycine/D-amino acid oxidase-like deaminating enzyme